MKASVTSKVIMYVLLSFLVTSNSVYAQKVNFFAERIDVLFFKRFDLTSVDFVFQQVNKKSANERINYNLQVIPYQNGAPLRPIVREKSTKITDVVHKHTLSFTSDVNVSIFMISGDSIKLLIDSHPTANYLYFRPDSAIESDQGPIYYDNYVAYNIYPSDLPPPTAQTPTQISFYNILGLDPFYYVEWGDLKLGRDIQRLNPSPPRNSSRY